MKIFKISGIVLLVAGIALIVWVLVFSQGIFLGKTDAPNILKMEFEILEKTAQEEKQISVIEQEIEKMIAEQLKDFLPGDTLLNLLNLVAYSIFSFILIFGGSQIASIGIKLIKND